MPLNNDSLLNHSSTAHNYRERPIRPINLQTQVGVVKNRVKWLTDAQFSRRQSTDQSSHCHTVFFNAFHCKGTRAGHDDRVNQYGLYSILIQTITCTIMGSIDRWIGLIGTECENTHAYEFIELDCYGFAHRFICLFPILHYQYRCDQLMTALISIYIYTLRESSRYLFHLWSRYLLFVWRTHWLLSSRMCQSVRGLLVLLVFFNKYWRNLFVQWHTTFLILFSKLTKEWSGRRSPDVDWKKLF